MTALGGRMGLLQYGSTGSAIAAKRMNNFFSLFAHGDNFDVDEYLKTATLTFNKVWHRGDLRGCAEFIQDAHPTSGISRDLGNGWELPLHKQDQIATNFLERNEAELKQLADSPGVDTFILGLHRRIELTPRITGFCVSASPRLMYFALRIGIDVTFYVDMYRKDFNT